MGVLNVTPDSFSDGGRHADAQAACDHAHAMAEAGAAIIDIGGESTRPGAAAISGAEQLRRVIPVIARIASTLETVISVDTSDPLVMREAVAAGAGMINDIRALQAPGAMEAASELQVPVVLMHMQGEPKTMQQQPDYTDVVAEVAGFLQSRMNAAQDAGIPFERLLIDPGFGFGKRLEHNLQLLARLESIVALGAPVLVGLSRKSMLGAVTGADLNERLPAGLAAAVMAVERGAAIVRTHDVAATVQAMKMVQATRIAA
ncbi:Dihydropteroate synthase [Thiorhodovibrio winogradskyi]|uniref:dihydropteroate synthase n=1 Tax=Thiorhodovibrio winogradskyi TaxID=77007 RepID=A0ABZ0SFY1_9GAMM|nr:dihydropteroate synthase [Thiorhodovibrio winogradskyi]